LCKPCAFFHRTEGCTNGEKCEYCHLCPEGEIKRRKKAKQSLKKLLMQHQNLFLNGNNKNINALLFNSSNINSLINFLQTNKQPLQRMNAEYGRS
jgi:hypothetical protein